MKMGIKGNLKTLLQQSKSRNLERFAKAILGWEPGGRLTYAQEAEDIILNKIFNETVGFFVDVGAFHPTHFSNTYLLYERGWIGINIEARPDAIDLFSTVRPRDINLNFAISKKEDEMIFYVMDKPGMSTFDQELVAHNINKGRKIISEINIRTIKLSTLLDRYLPEGQSIDFLTVDVENYDLEVLESNNWKKYRPNLILVESLSAELSNIQEDKIYQYLTSLGYTLKYKPYNTCFYFLET